MKDHDLAVHLQNHWVAATGGVDFARRVAGAHEDASIRSQLDGVAEEVREDREALRAIMAGAGVRPATLLPLVARISERVARLKPNGHVIQRSAVADVLELESLRAAVMGKRAGWETLLALAESDERLSREQLTGLVERARGQEGTLAQVQRQVALNHAT